MNIEEAKEILQSYRATGADAQDPLFAEALALAGQNPELRAWFETQQRFDRDVMTDFDRAPVPANLRAAILAAAEKATDEAPGPQRVVAPRFAGSPKQTWWRAFVPAIGIAAAIAVVLAISTRLRSGSRVPAADSTIATFAIADAQDPSKHGGHGDEAKVLNHTLNTATTHLGDTLPVNFQSLHDSGCRTVHVDGHDVLEMCFRRNGVQFHCYIARRDDFPAVTAPVAPIVTEKKGAGVASWTDQQNLYIVISKPGTAPLQKLL